MLFLLCADYLECIAGFRLMVKGVEQELCLCGWRNLVNVLELGRWHFLCPRYQALLRNLCWITVLYLLRIPNLVFYTHYKASITKNLGLECLPFFFLLAKQTTCDENVLRKKNTQRQRKCTLFLFWGRWWRCLFPIGWGLTSQSYSLGKSEKNWCTGSGGRGARREGPLLQAIRLLE